MESVEDHDLIDMIIDGVRSCDLYTYVRTNVADPGLEFDISSTVYCHRSKQIQYQLGHTQVQRRNVRLPQFDCKGYVKGIIKRNLGCVKLKIMHCEHARIDSESDTIRVPVHMEIRDHIVSRTDDHTTAPELFTEITRQFVEVDVTPIQVYYWWSESFKANYRLVEDQMRSTRLLIERYRYNEVCKKVIY
ncbi:hypothetical protein BJV82DRAFT_622528 [Fennellomyces sp. T-0311]|nr:hypothetical protein BJV82DRAFT_622528 [Fennellomyces sp. T-0311]